MIARSAGKAEMRVPRIGLDEIVPCRWIESNFIVVLHCYFDGGNKSDSHVYDYVTLAALAGAPEQWKPFEAAWKENLDSHGAKWLHTSDAVAGNTPFSRDEGWNKKRIDAFVLDCAKIAGKHLIRPITEYDPGRTGLFPYTVTINLKDYVRARRDVATVPPSADEILAAEAVNACFVFGRDFTAAKHYSLVFDQNEPFRGHVLDRQRSPKFRKAFPMAAKIVSNTEADARFVPALQVADLFAYCYSHKRDTGTQRIWQRRILSFPSKEAYADYPNLIRPRTEIVSAIKSMRFPRRKPTR
jgi:hypothetical protein